MQSIQVGLFDTNTNELIALIEDSTQIPASLIQGRNLTISATIPSSSPLFGQVESIFLDLNNGQATNLENVAPYTLFGDTRRGFRPGGTIPSGQNILELTLYSENRRGGDVLGIVLLSFTIGDLPPNTPPTITSSDRVIVAENSIEALDINAADDRDSEGAGLTYALTGNIDDELFNINVNTGLLSFISPPDFESPTDSGADNTYNVEVTVTDSDGLQDIRQFAITASDVDESAATLTPTIVTSNTVAVPENGVLAINVNATDDLDSEGAGLTYRLTGNGDDELFSIDANTGILLFNSAPDFETPLDANSDNIYAVEVTVTDSGGLTDTQNLSVTVTDEQEGVGNIAPAIVSPSVATVQENQTLAIDVNAIDDRDSEAAGLTYSIIGGADRDRFQIDANTGMVSFIQAPQVANPEDSNGDNTYELQVAASDSDGLATTQDLAITVTSEFSLTNQFDHFITHNDGNANDVDDISALVIQAALINAAGLQDRTTFFYNNNLGEPNNTRRGELFNEFNQVEVMRTSAAFAETLGIQTYDYQSGIERTTQKLVDILNSGQRVLILEGGPQEATYRALERVAPENLSNITVLSHGSSTFNQTRNLATRRGVSFARNQADIIRDFPTLNRIAIPNQNGPDKSGDLGFNSSLWEWLDSTSDPVLQEARVLMSNNDGRRATNDASDAGMVFYLLTGNETADPLDARDFFQQSPPSLDSAPTLIAREPLSIIENQRQVLDLHTSAPNGDSEGSGLTYTISGGADRDRFEVDANGILRFRTAPVFNSPNDADGDNIYEVDVTVRDSAIRTDTDRLDIQVRPSGLPQIISGATATVSDGQVIALNIDAVDDVDEERSGLLYSITGGADGQEFRVDANTSGSTGLLTFTSPPDVNSPSDANRDNIYEVEVTVADSEGQTDSQAIRVTVGDGAGGTNTAPSIVSSGGGSTATISLDEAVTSVVNVQAIDDRDAEGSGLTYSLTGNLDDNLFAINPNTGAVSFLSPPDFEIPLDAGADNTYNLEVTVTDSGGLVDTQAIAAIVQDVDEGGGNTAPQIQSNASVSVAENTLFVLNVDSTDDSDSEGSGLTYQLTGMVDDALFEIDIATGELAFNSAPDFESPLDVDADNTYEVEVTVTDSDGLSDSRGTQMG